MLHTTSFVVLLGVCARNVYRRHRFVSIAINMAEIAVYADSHRMFSYLLMPPSKCRRCAPFILIAVAVRMCVRLVCDACVWKCEIVSEPVYNFDSSMFRNFENINSFHMNAFPTFRD